MVIVMTVKQRRTMLTGGRDFDDGVELVMVMRKLKGRMMMMVVKNVMHQTR